MRGEDLFESMEHLDSQVLERSERRKGRRSRPVWITAAAAVLVVAVALSITLQPHVLVGESAGSATGQAAALKVAVYPNMAPYPDESQYEKDTDQTSPSQGDSETPDPNEGQYVSGLNQTFDSDGYSQAYDAWCESLQAQRRDTGYAKGLENFWTKTVPVFLDGESGENRIYSPVNVYMALGMLAELTDGSSRQQVLDLLGASDIEALRSQANDLWNANYWNDGATASILASSLWLREDIPYVDSTLDTLADTYYASSFQGEMGSQELNQMLRDWINDQTGGLLADQVGEIGLDPDTVLALATTLYFRAKWTEEFSAAGNVTQAFHGPDGDRDAVFMRTSKTSNYYWGDNFGAVGLSLENSGTMWFLLPDEGTTPEELLEDSQAMEFLFSDNGTSSWENNKRVIVHLSVPKFDIHSQTDLLEGMETLGVTDALNPERADFSPTTQDVETVYLSQAQHGVRVAIDEEGVTAAAYTVMAKCTSDMPPEEEMDFVLDRPFLFCITSQDGLPLFVGIVNQP
ncbi:MAG: serpin family protein [Acutalibacter sp.]|jgi:serine protease inhibitor